MGQASSISDKFIPDTVDTVHYEVKKHAKILSEIGILTYDDFQKCLAELNQLSRKCLDPNGNQLVFAVRKGTDTSMLWKATVQIACVKVDPTSKQIERYNFLNLKQFIRVFKTFQSHIQVLTSSEDQQKQLSSSTIMDQVDNIAMGFGRQPDTGATSSSADLLGECSICMDRKPEVILPCAHTYCCPCIEQWNMNKKTCPICQEELRSTDDSWVLSELPDVKEINEKICTELMALSKTSSID